MACRWRVGRVVGADFQRAARLAGLPVGRIVLVALLTEGPLEFPAYPLIAKEGEILGSLMSNQGDVRRAIELAASGQVDVLAIATHSLPIEQAQRGMEMVHTKQDGAIKVLLNF